MKRLAVMQPYLFPYIGYWQLINAVDDFVILDDVNFIKRGWINRNNILVNGMSHRFTIPLDKPSQNKLIMETNLHFSDEEKQKFLDMIRMAYGRAKMFGQVYPIISEIINSSENDLTEYIRNSILCICKYLGINTMILKSSDIEKDTELRGEERIIALCKALNGNVYINPCGGKMLYSQERFNIENMQLYFLNPQIDKIIYKQGNNEFVKGLSIIDVMMYNDCTKIRDFLKMYELSKE